MTDNREDKYLPGHIEDIIRIQKNSKPKHF